MILKKFEFFHQKNFYENEDDILRKKSLNKEHCQIINFTECPYTINYSKKEIEYKNIYEKKEKILYLSKLILIDDSIQKNNEIIINTLKLFNFNPKYFNKLYIHSLKNNGDINHEIVKNFLDENYTSIKKKIIEYYNNKNQRENKINVIEELIELNNLVLNRETIESYQIIDFMKKYPIKYLIIEEIKKEDNYFIKLDEEYHSNKFICKFAFPFIGITINKIILETENSEEINIRNLTGSGLGSFLERKIFYAICSKKIFGQIENRYINSFSEVKKVIKNEYEYDRLDIYELIKNNNYDYLNYNRKILDDISNNSITNSNTNYYIQPKNQSNKSFDSAILINCNSNDEDKTFYLILFQITHHKKKSDIKTLFQYTSDSLTTKEYFEKTYSIIIVKVFFYYILSYEFKKEDTIEELKNYKIDFIYFSYKEMSIMNEKEVKINVNDLLNGKELKYENEKNISEKSYVIRFIEEKFVHRKRNNDFNYDYQSYELIRRKLLDDENYFYLTKTEIKQIINILKKNNQCFSSKNLTLIYNYYVDFSEFDFLRNKNDIIGLFSYQGNILLTYLWQIYEFISKRNSVFDEPKILGKIIKENLLKENKNERKKIAKNLNDLPKSQYIYIFTIYEIKE